MIDLKYYITTDIGKKRKINQDAVAGFVKGDTALFVVADGMGGHSHGELASQEIIASCEGYWNSLTGNAEKKSFSILLCEVEKVLLEANARIFQTYNQNDVCGSTVVALVVADGCYGILSVGDSHIYMYRDKEFSLITTDDVWENLSTTRERYSAEEIERHVNRGRLVSAMGIAPDVYLHVSTGRLADKQKFLLCSDGLYKYCDHKFLRKELKKIKSEDSMQKASKHYMDYVYKQGANDNISFVLVGVS